MSSDDTMRKLMLRQFIWIIAGLGMSFAISMGLWYAFGDAAFPWNIVILVGLFMGIGYVIQKRQLKKMGITPDKPSTSAGRKSWFSKATKRGKEYTCFGCGTVHRMDKCPKCGSRGGKLSL